MLCCVLCKLLCLSINIRAYNLFCFMGKTVTCGRLDRTPSITHFPFYSHFYSLNSLLRFVFPFSDKIMKKIEIGKNITIA